MHALHEFFVLDRNRAQVDQAPAQLTILVAQHFELVARKRGRLAFFARRRQRQREVGIIVQERRMAAQVARNLVRRQRVAGVTHRFLLRKRTWPSRSSIRNGLGPPRKFPTCRLAVRPRPSRRACRAGAAPPSPRRRRYRRPASRPRRARTRAASRARDRALARNRRCSLVENAHLWTMPHLALRAVRWRHPRPRSPHADCPSTPRRSADRCRRLAAHTPRLPADRAEPRPAQSAAHPCPHARGQRRAIRPRPAPTDSATAPRLHAVPPHARAT